MRLLTRPMRLTSDGRETPSPAAGVRDVPEAAEMLAEAPDAGDRCPIDGEPTCKISGCLGDDEPSAAGGEASD